MMALVNLLLLLLLLFLLLLVFLFVFLLILPATLVFEYDERWRITLLLGAVHLRLYPRKAKRRAWKKKPRQAAEREASKKRPEKERDLVTVLKLLASLVNRLRRKLSLRELTVYAYFGGHDPGQRALSYGRAWAAIGVLTPILEQSFCIKQYDVRAILDEDAPTIRVVLRMALRLRGYTVLRLVIWAGMDYLKKKLKKAVPSHESSK